MISVAKAKSKPIVSIVDSDCDVCDSLCSLLSGLDVELCCFNSARDFLNSAINHNTAFLIAEANLPGMGGVELLECIQRNGYDIPTVIVATYSDVPTAVRAMQAKAVDFLEKPFVEGVLLKHVEHNLKVGH